MNAEIVFNLMAEDWFSRGLSDAWLGKLKQAQVDDPDCASQYDLGYSEGLIKHQPNLKVE
jgi:hypothetical protein